MGGNEKNVEPGFTKWATTVGPNVLEYIPNSAKISEMVQTGEAGLFPLTPTAVGDLKDKGIPVEYVAPKEGAVLLLVDRVRGRRTTPIRRLRRSSRSSCCPRRRRRKPPKPAARFRPTVSRK